MNQRNRNRLTEIVAEAARILAAEAAGTEQPAVPLPELVKAVARMRRAQQQFYDRGLTGHAREAVEYERDVDLLLAKIVGAAVRNATTGGVSPWTEAVT